MSRRAVSVVASIAFLLPLAGCSSILGLSPPREGSGGPPADGPPAGGSYTFAILPLSVTVPQGGMNFIDVSVTRTGGYAEPVTVTIDAPPPGLQFVDAVIDAGSTTGHVQVTATSALALGTTLTLTLDASGGTGAAEIDRNAMVPATVTGAPGTLDNTFNGTGTLSIPGSRGSEGIAVSITADGKALGVGGTFGLAGPFPLITHLEPDGTFDAAFAGSGKEQLQVNPPGGVLTDAETVAIGHQISGKAVMVANDHADTGAGTNDVMLIRLNATGALDNTFGLLGNGPNEVGFLPIDVGAATDDSVTALAIDAVDRPVFAGTTNGVAYVGRTDASGFGLDTGFGGSGIVTTVAGSIAALTTDGTKRVIAVGGTQVAGHSQTLVFRLTAGGALDPTFHAGALETLGGATFDESAAAVFLQPDGKILLVGVTNEHGGFDVLLRRLNDDGSPDTTFGGDGHVVTSVSDGDDGVHAVKFLSDGRILLGLDIGGGPLAGPALARLLPDGTLDPTFGTNGAASIFFGDGGSLSSLDVDPLEQKIVIIGTDNGTTFMQFVMARFWN